jgi:hypothetical protein
LDAEGVRLGEGVAVAVVGKAVLALWQGPANAREWRELVFREIEQVGDGIVHVQFILPSSAPPDSEARAVLQADIKRLGKKLRKVITVALGDSFRQKIVRTVVRMVLLISGVGKQQVVAATIDEGLDLLLDALGPGASRAELDAAIDALFRARSLTPPVRSAPPH